jgi:hypothetical protein
MKTLKIVEDVRLQEGKGFYLGLDLGQSVDYSALVVLEKVADFEDSKQPIKHHIRFVKRWPLGTKYTDVTEDVLTNYVNNADLRVTEEERPSIGFRARPLLVIDATGVGAAVRDELVAKRAMPRSDLKAVVITGGLDEHFEKKSWRVPKSRLMEQLQVDSVFGMVKVAAGLELLDTLKAELANIRPKIRADQKYLSYEEIRESVHDDMVLAAALAHWGARKFRPRGAPSVPPRRTFGDDLRERAALRRRGIT